MNTKTVVFGGWACPPAMLMPLFGDCTYVDINLYASSVIESGELVPQWADILWESLKDRLGDADCVGGWSTGAIIALGLIRRIQPRKAILLSPTPSFCRGEGFRHGMPQKVVRGMMAGLRANREQTLEQFFQNCGLPRPFPDTSAYTTAQLRDGLSLLCGLSYPPSELAKISTSVLILHGEKDRIIPCQAGRNLAKIIHATFIGMDGGHGFFLGAPDTVSGHIRSFITYTEWF